MGADPFVPKGKAPRGLPPVLPHDGREGTEALPYNTSNHLKGADTADGSVGEAHRGLPPVLPHDAREGTEALPYNTSNHLEGADTADGSVGEAHRGLPPVLPHDGRQGTMAVPTKKLKRPITKEAIFHYVYGVLHDPVYREKYALNLKREFPRIPFYPDFWQWAEWGEQLMVLHIGYETVEPFPLNRVDVPDDKARKAVVAPKALLKADKAHGVITLDTETTLSGIPKEAWDYKLGNRSALEWVLDQHKEKKPKDPTIREKFNTYRFADYKEKVADILLRVTTVSVKTVAMTEAMKRAPR